MTHGPDPRFADLLHEDAPPARDPMFRVELQGRIERAKYRGRVLALLVCALALAAIAAVGVGAGGAAREATGVLLVGVALVAAYVIAAPALTQLLARLRS